ncbi:MAG TPA: GWxTD domain-containing protein [Vicinamibacteria bacterium]|nr:GWxTD domain-containing protein [Vicinamibacteria bacterium]
MRSLRSVVLVLPGLLLLLPAPARAQKLDNDDKKFLSDVRPLILAEEEATFKKLKDKADRLEFQKIFWGRRDPDLATPENEFQQQYLKDRATADQNYRVSGTPGSLTDCGRTFILLGKPDEVQQRDAEGTMESGVRRPEVWTYKDRADRKFTGGKAVVAFDSECRAASGTFTQQLDRLAAAKIAHPNIDYKFGKDGHLVKLSDQLPKDTLARALFKQPRQDFPVAVQLSFLKVADGGTALLGLLRGEAAGLDVTAGGSSKAVNVSVAASALNESGVEAGWTEQTMSIPVGPDGAFIGSFKLLMKPGKYTLKAGAVDPKSGKGSLVSTPVEAPDFSKVETAADGSTHPVPTAAPLLLVRDIEDLPAGTNPDPANPYSAFVLGTARMVPYFGTTFHKTESISIFYQAYDLSTDLNGKADAMATVSILKGGAVPIATNRNPISTAVGASAIGPVSLASLEPGKYVIRLRVEDRMNKKEVVQETPIEVVP